MAMKHLRASLLSIVLLLMISSVAHALTGAQVAQLLNTRYNAAAAACVGNRPAYFCSGVLVRGVAADHAGVFWAHSPDAIAQGAESFTWLRVDLSTAAVEQKNGVVFTDAFTAVGQGKTLEVLCVYPFVAGAQGTRPDFGCGLPARLLRQETDVSSCAALGIVDAEQWLAHFRQQDFQPNLQCSLSTQDPAQFKASLEAHERIDADWSSKPNELMIRNWDSQSPKLIPIEALFYDSTQAGALLGAQLDQRDYFDATGDWLPILRMDLSDSQTGVFGFNLRDQLYIGYTTAAALNARYADTSTTCRGEYAGYFCNGVLFRSTQATTAYHAWNPSPGSVTNNGVSFSYTRADVTFTVLVYNRPFGFIFRELLAPAGHPQTLRCAYPYDAATGGSTDPCTFRGECEALGITSVELWQQHYSATPGRGCAFSATPAQFQLSIDVRRVVPDIADSWNEIMMAAWPQNIPLQLPLEALFYSQASGLGPAQFIQRDFYNQTGHFLPIVLMDLAATDGQVFNYAPLDQVAPGSPSIRQQINESGAE